MNEENEKKKYKGKQNKNIIECKENKKIQKEINEKHQESTSGSSVSSVN